MGGFAFTESFFPNTAPVVSFAPGVTTWVLAGKNGATYASLAACYAAGDIPWPGNELCVILGMATLKVWASGGGDGSDFFYLTDPSPLPQNSVGGFPIRGTNQGFTLAGPIHQLWLRLTASSDQVYITGRY